MRKILFTTEAFEEYNDLQAQDKKAFNKLKKLIIETTKTPFDGTGKPEALKYDYTGCWSRRVTDEHRLIYKVIGEHIIEIIACKFHYK